MATVSITDDQRLCVIGDIHGRSDLLDQIIQKISREAARIAGDQLSRPLGLC
jgi:hypothetical protein